MILIGICGKAGTGKDTAADFLVGNEGFKRYAFADPVKDIAAILFNTDRKVFDGDGKKILDRRWNLTRRQMAQLVGTEMVRDVLSQDHWVKLLDMRINKRKVARNVITDVRFPNEVEYIVDNGGFIIHLESSSRAPVLSSIESSHQSEHPLDFTPAIVHNRYFHYRNDGTMKQFKSAILDIYEKIYNKQFNLQGDMFPEHDSSKSATHY